LKEEFNATTRIGNIEKVGSDENLKRIERRRVHLHNAERVHEKEVWKPWC